MLLHCVTAYGFISVNSKEHLDKTFLVDLASFLVAVSEYQLFLLVVSEY